MSGQTHRNDILTGMGWYGTNSALISPGQYPFDLNVVQSDCLSRAGGLMSGAASKAVGPFIQVAHQFGDLMLFLAGHFMKNVCDSMLLQKISSLPSGYKNNISICNPIQNEPGSNNIRTSHALIKFDQSHHPTGGVMPQRSNLFEPHW